MITIAGATLPSGFPNYQSINDALVASLSAAQTSLQPAAATLALTMRADATATASTSADEKTVTILVLAKQASTRAASPSPSPLPVVAARKAVDPTPVPVAIVRTPAPVPERLRARKSSAIAVERANTDATVTALRSLFPAARLSRVAGARAILVLATENETRAIRQVVEALDLQAGPHRVIDAIPLHTVRGAQRFLPIVRRAFPNASLSAGPNDVIVVGADPNDAAAIRGLLGTLDTASPAATGATSDVIPIANLSPRDLANTLRPAFRDVRFTSGTSAIVVAGPAESIDRAKAAALRLDVPVRSVTVVQVYKLHATIAADAARVLRTAFPGVSITDDAATNSIVVRGRDGVQTQIVQALATIDTVPVSGGGGGTTTEVIQVLNAVPGTGTTGSTTTTDIATALTAILGPTAPDLRVVVPANSTLLAISGSPQTIREARDILAKIDVPIAQIVLDTAVYEVSETAARNLGVQLGTPAVLSTSISEIVPQASAFATAPPFLAPQRLTRTPLSIQAQLNLLIQSGQGRVLADPRIATISGRTATIRAGDNIPYVQQGSGALGAVTSTVLTFSTGVTLDITPIANPDGRISVNIHPIINTETGVTSQQVPQISSREAQTTVNLRDGETVVIGGLIQESDLDANTKIPLLGDIPLVGGAFRNKGINRARNELIILVTPHLVPPDGSLDRVRPIDIQANRLAPSPTPAPAIRETGTPKP